GLATEFDHRRVYRPPRRVILPRLFSVAPTIPALLGDAPWKGGFSRPMHFTEATFIECSLIEERDS
ncbi:hypothetical protein, partial [Pseudomonas sp. AGC67]